MVIKLSNGNETNPEHWSIYFLQLFFQIPVVRITTRETIVSANCSYSIWQVQLLEIFYSFSITFHCTKKSFPLKISSVNVTKSAVIRNFIFYAVFDAFVNTVFKKELVLNAIISNQIWKACSSFFFLHRHFKKKWQSTLRQMLYGSIKGFIGEGKPIQKVLVQMLERFFSGLMNTSYCRFQTFAQPW